MSNYKFGLLKKQSEGCFLSKADIRKFLLFITIFRISKCTDTRACSGTCFYLVHIKQKRQGLTHALWTGVGRCS